MNIRTTDHTLRTILGLSCCLFFFGAITGCGNGAASAPATPATNAGGKPTEPTSKSPADLEKVELLLNWFPEVEHGGFYAALVHGLYRESGLDVTIRRGGPGVPVIQEVARQNVTFGISNADGILLGRNEDAPVVAVMAPIQISPRCIMVHRKSGIKSFEGLKNITIAMTAGSPFGLYLQKKFPLDGVKIVPYPGNVAQFLLTENYAQQGYVFSEPYVAESKGGDPEVLMVADVGFNPYTSCLIAHEKTIASKPELVRKMVQASVKGWVRYLEDPDETNRKIHDVNPEMEVDVLDYGVRALTPLVLDSAAKADGIGTMSPTRWSDLKSQLLEIGQLDDKAVKSDSAFTTQFLEKPQ